MLDESFSYDKLVGTICERMGISIFENKVQIIWKRTICVGSGVMFIGTLLEEVCMPLIFSVQEVKLNYLLSIRQLLNKIVIMS